jgi:hypothetical protein
MRPFEYLLLFAVVILGLAVSELAINLNRLLKAKSLVRWDVLASLAALVAFLKIVTQWWVWFQAEAVANALTFEMYLLVLIEAVLLFLLAGVTLPGEVPEQGISLRESYESIRQRFWLLFAAQWMLWVLTNWWVQVRIEGAKFVLLQPAMLFPPAILLVIISAFIIRNRVFQMLVLLGFIFLYLWQFFGKTLA